MNFPHATEEEVVAAWRSAVRSATAFTRKYRFIDRDEAVSIAGEVTVRAARKYRPPPPGAGKRWNLTGWVRWNVKNRLLMLKRQNALRYRLLPPVDAGDMEEFRERQGGPGCRLARLAGELSGDAATLISLIIDPPKDITEAARKKDSLIRTKARKGAVYRYLRELGWCCARITESVEEIRHALRESRE